MKHIDYKPTGVCCRLISFDLTDDKKIQNLVFTGGCNGNLKAIGKLCEGQDAQEISNILYGNTCHDKRTSCADQLAKAIIQAVDENK